MRKPKFINPKFGDSLKATIILISKIQLTLKKAVQVMCFKKEIKTFTVLDFNLKGSLY
jgi:hypothetical protein